MPLEAWGGNAVRAERRGSGGAVRRKPICPLKVGFPIRKSADQSLFAAPHGLSQRTTSFIACACQGIHRTPLRHLIALIIDARPFQDLAIRERNGRHSSDPSSDGRTGPSAPASTGDTDLQPRRRADGASWKDQCHTRTARRRGGQASPAFARPRQGADVRTTLLFTMSANRQHAATDMLQNRRSSTRTRLRSMAAAFAEPEQWSTGGARRDRTDDLLLAKQALSQLSYGPSRGQTTDDRGQNLLSSVV